MTAVAVAAPGGAGPHAARRGRHAARAAAAAAGVVAFWWGATGALLALERSAATRVLALALAAGAAAAGFALVERARRGGGARAAAAAVLGGALLWTCVSAAFYGGWVVGPRPGAPFGAPPDAALGTTFVAHAPTLARAGRALAATAYSAALAALLLALATWQSRRGAPDRAAPDRAARYAPLTLAALWAAHELAKLNVFVGVASPGASYLPPYLAHLRAYFGPARNTPLLACTVALLGLTAVLLAALAARAARDPARRTGLGLLAGVLALAAFEHAMLGVAAPPRWWNAFVGWRDAPAATVRPLPRPAPAPTPRTR